MNRAGGILAAIAVAAAAPRAASASGFPRLVSPAPAGIVHPGERVEIAVAGAPADTDEWEAFLSLDGGRSFALRATPHLPAGERSFAWTVPALPPGPIRVKVRFGAGGVEREYVLAETFSVAPGAGALVAPDLRGIGASPAPGEDGTVAWVERRDGRARLVVPVPVRGVVPARSWAGAARASLPAPRRIALADPVLPRGRRLAPAAPVLVRIAPPGRTLASLSRLNV